MSFVDKAYYRATVVKQEFVQHAKDGYPILELHCRLGGQLIDNRRPDAGTIACEEAVVITTLQFDPTNDQKVDFAVRDLESLGYTGEDLSRLAPDHPKHHSFVGKAIVLTPSIKSYNGVSNTYWNLRFPGSHNDKTVPAKDLSNTKAAQAYREALERRKQEKADKAEKAAVVPF